VADFFQFVGGKHPVEVLPYDVIAWKDHLRQRGDRPDLIVSLNACMELAERAEGQLRRRLESERGR
jgi:hypothetical protein